MKLIYRNALLAASVCFAGSVKAAPVCNVQFDLRDQWQDGLVADINISNLSAPVNGWTLSFDLGQGVRITNGWDGNYVQSGTQITIKNLNYNGNINNGQTIKIGFQALHKGNVQVPRVFTLNGQQCGLDSAGDGDSAPPPAGPAPGGSEDAGSDAVWALDNAASTFNFVSTKKENVAEVSSFEQLSGGIDADGNARITIDTASVSTNIAIRDERMREFFFESELFPIVYFDADIDREVLENLAVGDAANISINGTLSMHGIRKALTAEVLLSKVSSSMVTVRTRTPVIVSARDFDLSAGLELLRRVVAISSINQGVPVSFNLVFKTQANAQLPALDTIPSQPQSLQANFNSATRTISLQWQDTSNNETGFVIKRLNSDGDWITFGSVGANTTQFSGVLSEVAASSQFKVVAINATQASVFSDAVTVDTSGGVDEPDDGGNDNGDNGDDAGSGDGGNGGDNGGGGAGGGGDAGNGDGGNSGGDDNGGNDDGNDDGGNGGNPGNNAALLRGQQLYIAQCQDCHGATGDGFFFIDMSKFNETNLPDYIVTEMPPNDPNLCVGECGTDVAAYMLNNFSTDPAGGDNGGDDTVDVNPQCDNIAYGPRQLKLLTRSQYQNSMEELVGVDFDVSGSIPFDTLIHGYTNNTNALVTETHADAYLAVAKNVAEFAAQNNFAQVVDCGIDANGNSSLSYQQCTDKFLDEFGTRAFRRPLTAEEKALYRGAFDTSLTSGSIVTGLKLGLTAMLMSPDFLYRSELGQPVSDMVINDPNSLLAQLDDDAFVLSPFELASYLSFTLTGTTPDVTLLNAAKNGQLETDAQILTQVTRLLNTEAAREHLGDFAAEWLGTDDILTRPKNPDLFPGLTDPVREAMAEEVRALFTHVFYDENESFPSLFDANYTFLNSTLARFYGISGVNSNEMVKVGTVERGGLLATGAFLGSYAGAEESSPIIRATTIRERLLCHFVPPPPNNINESRTEEEERLKQELSGQIISNRDFVDVLTTSNPICASCHEEIINPLGFGLEDFDAVGRHRTVDLNGLNIDSSGVLIGIDRLNDGATLAFNGTKDLSNRLASLDATQACFVANSFRFAIGIGHDQIDKDNPEAGTLSDEEQRDYSCAVETLSDTMAANNQSLRALFNKLSTLQLVRFRKERIR